MKNSFYVVVAVCVGIILYAVNMFYYNVYIIAGNNGEHFILENKELYEKALRYLEDEHNDSYNPDKSEEKYHFFITYDGFGMTEKDGYKYAYMWVLAESHYLKDGEIKDGSAYSVFHKFKFKDDEVVSYQVPQDGSYYTKSIEEMCIDKGMSNKVLNYNLKLSLDKEVKDYYK